jgi:hypothetical protein
VAKSVLPPELPRQSLAFSELISTLKTIDGETVIIKLNARVESDGPPGGLASMVGDLHQQRPARYPGHEFSIGDPYPDRSGPHLGGGILFIDEPTFEDASLHTFDGNEYFRISIPDA